MRAAERLAGLALLAFAVYVYASARPMLYASRGIPGPGFAPFWVSLVLGAAAVLVIVRAWTLAPFGPFIEDRTAVRRLAILGTAMVTATLLIPLLGMALTLGLFIAGTVPLLGGRGWTRIAAAAVLIPGLLLLVFQNWLQVPFPKGPLGF